MFKKIKEAIQKNPRASVAVAFVVFVVIIVVISLLGPKPDKYSLDIDPASGETVSHEETGGMGMGEPGIFGFNGLLGNDCKLSLNDVVNTKITLQLFGNKKMSSVKRISLVTKSLNCSEESSVRFNVMYNVDELEYKVKIDRFDDYIDIYIYEKNGDLAAESKKISSKTTLPGVRYEQDGGTAWVGFDWSYGQHTESSADSLIDAIKSYADSKQINLRIVKIDIESYSSESAEREVPDDDGTYSLVFDDAYTFKIDITTDTSEISLSAKVINSLSKKDSLSGTFLKLYDKSGEEISSDRLR